MFSSCIVYQFSQIVTSHFSLQMFLAILTRSILSWLVRVRVYLLSPTSRQEICHTSRYVLKPPTGLQLQTCNMHRESFNESLIVFVHVQLNLWRQFCKSINVSYIVIIVQYETAQLDVAVGPSFTLHHFKVRFTLYKHVVVACTSVNQIYCLLQILHHS